jgi:hypothetical protein
LEWKLTAIAILFGNASYRNEHDLPCCVEDVAAMKALVEATGRFSAVHTHIDLNGDRMRQALREAVQPGIHYEEVFYYFSGHGTQIGEESYHCGTDYDGRRPNVTALSQNDLHDIVRAGNPQLLVKVIDACCAGTLLIKSDNPPPQPAKGFQSVFQFASSLNNQPSNGGDPLSDFTRVFLDAATEKQSGVVFYSDLANIIRDRFRGNEEQTPHFTNQSTNRDMLVDDATKFGDVRAMLATKYAPVGATPNAEDAGDGETAALPGFVPVPAQKPSPKQLLEAAEAKIGDAARAKRLIDDLFDGVHARFNAARFEDCFEQAVTTFPEYRDRGGDTFMTRILTRESRADEMVTAKIERTRKKRYPWDSLSTLWALGEAEWTESFELNLNCTLERAQLRMLMTPCFRTLEQPKLVLTIAPSLDAYYIFEVVTLHQRSDWEAYSEEGKERVRRWYKRSWDSDVEDVVEKIRISFETAVDEHLSAVLLRLDRP